MQRLCEGKNHNGFSIVGGGGGVILNGTKEVEYINMHVRRRRWGIWPSWAQSKDCSTRSDINPTVESTKSLSEHALAAAGIGKTTYTIIIMNNDIMAESADIKDLMEN